MTNKQLNRRTFLKYLNGMLTGAILLPLTRLFQENKTTPNTTVKPKEAKYYGPSNDELAG